MTEERLAALEVLCQAATEGPWNAAPEINYDIYSLDHGWVAQTDDDANSDFIAEARTALPELLAEVRRLRECLEVLAQATKLGAEHHNSHLWAYIMGEALQEDPTELPTWEGENRQ